MDNICFTVEELEGMLPEIAFLIDEAMTVQDELKEVSMASITVKSTSSNDKLMSVSKKERKLRVLNQDILDIIEEIEDLGGIVRDLDNGVVDFPGEFEGKEIYFCWQAGEDHIWYWHEKDSGDRKRIMRLGE
ncbi:DUF2203 domain-containing protein [Nanoarchaeota archaeon]